MPFITLPSDKLPHVKQRQGCNYLVSYSYHRFTKAGKSFHKANSTRTQEGGREGKYKKAPLIIDYENRCIAI